MDDDRNTIEGQYTVTGETTTPVKPPREPIFGPWKAIGAFAGFLLLQALFAAARVFH